MWLYNMWYFFYFGGIVCVWPFINLLYRSNGLSDAQIGVLAALKPWTSAPSSFLWSGLADRLSAHKAIMLATFITSTLTRAGVSLAHSFWAFVVLAVAGEVLAAPVGVMADAAVVAACKRDIDYGKSRLWGAIGWGSLSLVSGSVLSRYGMSTGFLAYLLLSLPCVYCAWRMEFKLGAKHAASKLPSQQQQQQQQCDLRHLEPKEAAALPPEVVEGIGVSTTGRALVASVQQQNQQPDDHCNRIDQWELQDSKQQHLLLKASSADAVAAAERRQTLQGQELASETLQPQQRLQDQQQHGLQEDERQQQVQQQLVYNIAAGSTEEADACVLLLHNTDNHAAASRHSCQQGQQQHRQNLADARHSADMHSISSRAGNQQGAGASLQQQQQQQQASHDFWQGLRQLLSSPAVLIFMWQATVMGFGIGVIGEFLFLFLQDLGGSETLMGLTLTVTCLTEVPVFHFQPQILKLVSVHTMLNIVMWTYVLRMGLYALLPYAGNAWAVLPVELLHGVTFGCGWSAGTITSKRVAPPGLEATMQGIFQGLYFGVGQGLGALVGGLLKQRHGGQAMFALCAGIVLAGWLLCVVAELAATHLGKAGLQCGIDGHGSSTASQEQPWRQQQQGAPAAAAGRLRALLRKLMGRLTPDSVGMCGGDTAGWSLPASGVSRLCQQKYTELASKDSGPDLQRYVQGCAVDSVSSAGT